MPNYNNRNELERQDEQLLANENDVVAPTSVDDHNNIIIAGADSGLVKSVEMTNFFLQ